MFLRTRREASWRSERYGGRSSVGKDGLSTDIGRLKTLHRKEVSKLRVNQELT